jgi:hypothetical protein
MESGRMNRVGFLGIYKASQLVGTSLPNTDGSPLQTPVADVATGFASSRNLGRLAISILIHKRSIFEKSIIISGQVSNWFAASLSISAQKVIQSRALASLIKTRERHATSRANCDLSK